MRMAVAPERRGKTTSWISRRHRILQSPDDLHELWGIRRRASISISSTRPMRRPGSYGARLRRRTARPMRNSMSGPTGWRTTCPPRAPRAARTVGILLERSVWTLRLAAGSAEIGRRIRAHRPVLSRRPGGVHRRRCRPGGDLISTSKNWGLDLGGGLPRHRTG